MNVKNNKRRQASREQLEGAFIQMLQEREITQITVSDICKQTGLNRSTFYANYVDIYDLADHIRRRLEGELQQLYGQDIFNKIGTDYLRLFRHIRENQLFYITYFKLGYDSRHVVDLGLLTRESKVFPEDQIEYHIEFHKAGLNAIIKKWLAAGCDKTPEAMVKILQDEYTNRR